MEQCYKLDKDNKGSTKRDRENIKKRGEGVEHRAEVKTIYESINCHSETTAILFVNSTSSLPI